MGADTSKESDSILRIIKDPEEKSQKLIRLYSSFVSKARVGKTEVASGRVIQKWYPLHTEALKKLFRRAMRADTDLVVVLSMDPCHVKTGAAVWDLKIYQTGSQEPMLRNMGPEPGQGLTLSYVSAVLDMNSFDKTDWHGSWYDDKYQGDIEFED
jgi:hypothetical protein